MKVLIIDVNCKGSSTGKIVYDLYTELNSEGHEASLCYGRGKEIKEKNIYKFGLDWETKLHALLTRFTGLTGIFSFFSTRRLIKYMEDFKPDVVHIHELHAYFVNITPVINYLKKKNIKTIWTFHCEFMYTGKCGYAYECEKWKKECNKCPQVKEYPKSLFFDFTRLMFNQKKKLFKDFSNLTIVTPSKWLADRVKMSFLGDKKIEVIHNGIDTDNVFYPRGNQSLKDKLGINYEKIFLAVAPDLMSERKGGKWIVELAKRFVKENVKFIMIGIADLSEVFPSNVIPLGKTENQVELAEFYSMADVFIICSKRENFPTTCIETLSCGTPVIGFDEGGTAETAPDKFGHFVKFGDVDSLEIKLRELLNGSICFENTENCRNFANREYSKKAMYLKYKDMYERG